MINISKVNSCFLTLLMLSAFMVGCQKMDRPELGDYPQDTNPPGGPLNFYAAFDGSAVDSIRATFPSDNPLTFTDGVTSKSVLGESQKFVKYVKPNDWVAKAKSFTVSSWMKRDGQTKNNIGGNGPEYIFSLQSSNGHWAGASMFVLVEGDNAAAAVKVMVADTSKADKWFEWAGGDAIPGLLDNAWHHIGFVYDAGTSSMTLYVDGVANSNIRTWDAHGDIRMDDSKITEFRVGAGPGKNLDKDDWLSSTWKGSLDQLRLYSTALPAAEISMLFTNKM